MKRTLSFLMALALLACLAGEVRPASANGVFKYVATYDYYGLKLRPEPNTTKTEYCKIPHGTLLSLASISEDGLWYHTNYGGYWGWVMAKYLVDNPPRALKPSDPGPGKETAAPRYTAAPIPPAENTVMREINGEFQAMMRNAQPENMIIMCTRRGTKCNIRWAPSTSSATIRTDVVYGDVFTVLSIGNKWYQVYDAVTNRTGYILISLTGLATTLNNSLGQ